MNKRGGMFDLIILMVVAFVAVLFFAGWIFASSQITERLLLVPNTEDVNITDATQKTFSKVDEALAGLKWFAAAMIFGSILAIMVSNFLVKAHPVFFVPYLLFVVISVIFSAYISNAYVDILLGGPLSSTLQDWSFVNYFFTNLPVVITLIGLIGGIMLFIGITVDKDMGGSLT